MAIVGVCFEPFSLHWSTILLFSSSSSLPFFLDLGKKSYDITKLRSKAEVWYDWVESAGARHHMRRMVLSRGALGWTCKRLVEASGIRGKFSESWRCRDFSANFFMSLKFNQYGRYIFLVSVKVSNRVVFIISENAFNEG